MIKTNLSGLSDVHLSSLHVKRNVLVDSNINAGTIESSNGNFFNGITSNIQDQINSLSHTGGTLDLINYVDKTSAQDISGIKTFPNGLIVNGSNIISQLSDTNNILNTLPSYAQLNSPSFTTQITTPKVILGSTDLQTTLNSKANIDSPNFTNQITTPKLLLGTSDLESILNNKAPITSPSFNTLITTPKILLNGFDLQGLIDLKANLSSPNFSIQISTPKIVLNGNDLQNTLDTKISDFTIGTVTTLTSSQSAYVTKRGTSPNYFLDFGLPTGATPTFTIGTVETLPYGSVPTVTMVPSLTVPNSYTLNFKLVTGAQGPKGDDGNPKGITAQDIMGALGLGLSVADFLLKIGAIAFLQSEVQALGASISALQLEILALQAKTEHIDVANTVNPILPLGDITVTNGTYFLGDILLGDILFPSVYLGAGSQASQFYEGITVRKQLTIKNDNTGQQKCLINDTGDITNQGSITTAGNITCNGNLSVGGTNGGKIQIGHVDILGTENNIVNIDGDVINIGEKGAGNYITIGNSNSLVFINGAVQNYSKQERKYTRPNIPFLNNIGFN
jgi:hypothetical protein